MGRVRARSLILPTLTQIFIFGKDSRVPSCPET
jgi:hypothetical protein